MKEIIKFIKKNWFYILILALIISVAIILKKYYNNTLENFDKNIYEYITKHKNDTLTSIFKFISHLCGPIFMPTLMLLILIFGKNKEYKLYTVIVTTGSFILNYIIKFIIKRPRPEDINLIIETGYSFPSSHAMVSISFYGFLLYIIAHSNYKTNKKIILCAMISILIFLVGISRIYLGVHYASDVLAGFIIGLAYLLLFIKNIYNKKKIKLT